MTEKELTPYQELKKRAKGLGCKAVRSPHEYEIAVIRADGVQLVVYPHKTNQGHVHWRIRDNGSKNKKLADFVMSNIGLKRKNG